MFLKGSYTRAQKKTLPWFQSDESWKNAALDLSAILFIKSELHCKRFAPLCNSEICIYSSPFHLAKAQFL